MVELKLFTGSFLNNLSIQYVKNIYIRHWRNGIACITFTYNVIGIRRKVWC